jgi:hypothetical protein
VFIMTGVAVFWTPRRGVGKPGTGTGFSLMARSSVEHGTFRRTSFLCTYVIIVGVASNCVG